jgi:hypothetical protein
VRIPLTRQAVGGVLAPRAVCLRPMTNLR